MTQIQRQVKRARRQLVLNRFARLLGWTLCAAAGAFGLTVVAQRLFDIGLPLGWAALGWAGLGVGVAAVWALARRASAIDAATVLDEAAGLKERISSGLYCARSDDAFARAVVADAEGVGAALTVSRHLPLRWPETLNYAGVAAAAALLTLLLPQWNVLARSEPQARETLLARKAEVAQAAWQTKLDEIKKTAKDNPLLKDQVEKMEEIGTGRLENTQDVQRETIKRLEALRESVERQREQTAYQSVQQLKSMLGRIPQEKFKNAHVNKLAEALSKGDFSEAKKALQQMQEQLAKADDAKDEALRKELEKQLADLAGKLEQLAAQKKLDEMLKREGLSPEQIERLLAQLEKKDLEAIRKQLQQQGMSKEKAEELAKQLAKTQAANQMAQRLASSLSKSAAGAMAQAGSDMQEGLGEAMGELSELEQLELQMSDMEATLASLSEWSQDALEGCSACGGTGMRGGQRCGRCRGSGMRGPGMGETPGRGEGGMAPEQQTQVGFQRQRTPVKSTEGRIIGKFLVEGEQYKGEVSPEYREAVISGQRDATEALENEQVPPQYHKALKEYFTRLGAASTPPKDDAKSSDDQR